MAFLVEVPVGLVAICYLAVGIAPRRTAMPVHYDKDFLAIFGLDFIDVIPLHVFFFQRR
jgi:hypothetical protein